MSPHSFRRIGSRIIAVLFLILVFPHVAGRCSAELLADHATVSVRQHEQWHLVRSTLLRDSTTGVLTMVPNTTVSFKDACGPTTIDPTGNFLYPITITITAAAAGSSKALQLNPISLTLIVN